jgi:hypothetical protein
VKPFGWWGGGALALLLATVAGSPAQAAKTQACKADPKHPEISCVTLSETLLLSLRGETPDRVRQTMGVPGASTRPHALRFVLRAGGPTDSVVNVLFERDRATIVNATTGDGKQFIWNAYAAAGLEAPFDLSSLNFERGAFCSDLSAVPGPCAGGTMERELLLTKMAFGARNSDLLAILDQVCRQQGPDANDPESGCQELRARLH